MTDHEVERYIAIMHMMMVPLVLFCEQIIYSVLSIIMIGLEIRDANFVTAGRKTGKKSKIDSSLHNTGLKHSYVCTYMH